MRGRRRRGNAGQRDHREAGREEPPHDSPRRNSTSAATAAIKPITISTSNSVSITHLRP